jgi:hypothetical protein
VRINDKSRAIGTPSTVIDEFDRFNKAYPLEEILLKELGREKTFLGG